MAAPASTTRQTPTGIMLDDGFKTLVAFARKPAVKFWEKTIKPPGIDGGDAIDQTTQHNTAWRTKAARALKSLTDSALKVGYDPKVYTEIQDLVNLEGSVTVRFPDGSTLDFFGYLKTFEPSELQEGTSPEASITIIATNWDPVNHVEAAPVLTEVSGT